MNLLPVALPLPAAEGMPGQWPVDLRLWRVEPSARAAPDRQAAHQLLRAVLGLILERRPDSLDLVVDEFGKPRLTDGGTVRFNLSHCGPETLIGVADDWEIGVDIERVRPVVDAEALVALHFTDEEREQWAGAKPARRDWTFLECWTRKEACAKALGVGLLLEPAALGVGCVPLPRAVGIPVAGDSLVASVCSLDLPGGAVAAVAVTRPATAERARRSLRRARSGG